MVFDTEEHRPCTSGRVSSPSLLCFRFLFGSFFDRNKHIFERSFIVRLVFICQSPSSVCAGMAAPSEAEYRVSRCLRNRLVLGRRQSAHTLRRAQSLKADVLNVLQVCCETRVRSQFRAGRRGANTLAGERRHEGCCLFGLTRHGPRSSPATRGEFCSFNRQDPQTKPNAWRRAILGDVPVAAVFVPPPRPRSPLRSSRVPAFESPPSAARRCAAPPAGG